MNDDTNESGAFSASPADKEPWNYQRFVDAYNAHVDEQGGWRFILRDDDELHDLEESYRSESNDYATTLAAYAMVVFTSEQKVEDLDLKYKKSKAGRVQPKRLRNNPAANCSEVGNSGECCM